jgi:hypothetical protein
MNHADGSRKLRTSSGTLRPVSRMIQVVIRRAQDRLSRASSAESFALRILERHARALPPALPLNLIFRSASETEPVPLFEILLSLRSERLVTTHPVARMSPTMTPRELRGRASPMQTVAAASERRSSFATPQRPIRRPIPRAGNETRLPRAIDRYSVVERIFERQHRVEAECVTRPVSPASAPSFNPPLASLPIAPRALALEHIVLPRQIGRHAPAEEKPPALHGGKGRSVDAAPKARLGERIEAVASAGAVPVKLSPHELAEVTQAVVREIDARIIAKRERLGSF